MSKNTKCNVKIDVLLMENLNRKKIYQENHIRVQLRVDHLLRCFRRVRIRVFFSLASFDRIPLGAMD